MSPPGRPKGEPPSAPREGRPMFPPGRPKGEIPSAPREGRPMFPPALLQVHLSQPVASRGLA